MPAGPVGSVWAAGSWPDDTWEANSWADAADLAFVLDLDTRLLVYLRQFYGVAESDLNTLSQRYLREQGSGEWSLRWQQLVQDATDAMT